MSKQSIKEIIAHSCNEIVIQLQRSSWDNKLFYIQWLAQTTYFVRHSTRLLTLCAAHCDDKQMHLHHRFISHAAEEKGHEKLSLMDLHHLGVNIDDIQENNATMSLYQPQYYWIQFQGPTSFFGYIFCLEIIAKEAGPLLYPKIEETYGPKATHFIRVHAEEDEDHVEKAFLILNDFAPSDIENILKNLRQSCDNYLNMLASCSNNSSAAIFKKAA